MVSEEEHIVLSEKIVNKELNALRLGSARDMWPFSRVEAF
ncbi:hypothetical protein C943_03118 [Mariniradius saccharolyticus AK6]|uniref:Uncharacterized protein n=1 Tax=Mariniradius saccharolyticus AK6 TaxID=1239962 RepID=M7X7X6_9BACT|nr:hypothetical protein C943_03118 [Mariniradius saccharolyticus AK6]